MSHSHTLGDGSSSITGKQIWDNFCALLVDLGPPLEVPRLSTLDSSTHREYLEFMSKYSNRNTDPVEHLFMETDIQVWCLTTSIPFNLEILEIGKYSSVRFAFIKCRR